MGSAALAALAAVLLLLSVVALYANRVLFDSDQFANHVGAAVEEPAVKDEIGRRITDGIVDQQPDLIAVRPVIEGVAGGVVGSGAFNDLLRAAVRDVHRAIFKRDQNTVTLTVADIGVVVGSALEQFAPKVANRIRSRSTAPILDGEPPSWLLEMARVAKDVEVLAIVLLVLAIVAAAGGLVLAPDWRRQLTLLGVSVAVGAVVALIGYQLARSAVVGQVTDPDTRAAVEATWDTFLDGLQTAMLIAAAAGVILAAATRAVVRPVPRIERPLRGGVAAADHGPRAAGRPRGPRRDPGGCRPSDRPQPRRGDRAGRARGRPLRPLQGRRGALAPDRPATRGGCGSGCGGRGRRRLPPAPASRGARCGRPRLGGAGRGRGGLDLQHQQPGLALPGRLQRQRPALRQAACRGRPPRHPQRDVGGRHPRVPVREPGPSDLTTARRRRPRPPDRHSLRNPRRGRRGQDRPGQAHQRRAPRVRRGDRPGGLRRRAADPRPAGHRRRRRSPDLHVPPLLRAGRGAARRGARPDPRLRGLAPRPGAGDRQRGLRERQGLRRRCQEERARRVRLQRPDRPILAHPRRDGLERPAVWS